AGLAGAPLALVGDKNRGLARLAHEIGERAVGRRRPRARVDQEQDRIGGRDRGLGLLLHAAGQAFGRGLYEPRRVDGGEGEIAEPRVALAPIAGNPREVVDQCEALADQAIEQRRLADVRPSDNGDREAHDQGQRVVNGALCPAAAMSAISAAQADPARRPRRTAASTRARRRPPAAASAAGQGPGAGGAGWAGGATGAGGSIGPGAAEWCGGWWAVRPS